MVPKTVIEFPYECPRCGARSELSVATLLRGEGLEAAQRALRPLLPVLRCPSCGKRPRRATMAMTFAIVVSGALFASVGSTFDLVMAPAMLILGFLGLLWQAGKVRRADGSATIRLATIPEARVLALPAAPTASSAPKPGGPSIPV